MRLIKQKEINDLKEYYLDLSNYDLKLGFNNFNIKLPDDIFNYRYLKVKFKYDGNIGEINNIPITKVQYLSTNNITSIFYVGTYILTFLYVENQESMVILVSSIIPD